MATRRGGKVEKKGVDIEIKELMEYIENSSFVEFELEREGFKLKLVRRPVVENGQAGVPLAAPVAAQAAAAPAAVAAAPGGATEPDDIHLLKSPIVGTFYRSSTPGGKPFVEPGEVVRKGQILCIVEAMKLMNEIESDCEGEVLEILVENGQPIEFGEPLFKIRGSIPS